MVKESSAATSSQPKALNIIRPASSNYALHKSLSHSSSGSTTSSSSQPASSNRRHVGSFHSANSSIVSNQSYSGGGSARKPRITSSNIIKPASEKHTLNIYHPPTSHTSNNSSQNSYHVITRKPSYYHEASSASTANTYTRPSTEIYKPYQQQQQQPIYIQQQQSQRPTKPYIVSSPTHLQCSDEKVQTPKTYTASNNNRPMSPTAINVSNVNSSSSSSSNGLRPKEAYRSVLGVINTPASLQNDLFSPPLVGTAVSAIESNNDTKYSSSDASALSYSGSKAESVDDDEGSELKHENNSTGTGFSIVDTEQGTGNEETVNESAAEFSEEEEAEEDSVINEARVNRKIADLELSISSLLTVNAMLESTVRKQASQLNQLRKEKASPTSNIYQALLPEQSHLINQIEMEENEEDDWEKDEVFQRLKRITEHMIEQGQKSIAFEYKILGRVLSNYSQLEDEEGEPEDNATINNESSIQDIDEDLEEDLQQASLSIGTSIAPAATQMNINTDTRNYAISSKSNPARKYSDTVTIDSITPQKKTASTTATHYKHHQLRRKLVT